MAEKKFHITKEQLEQDYAELQSMLRIAGKYGVSKKLVMNYMNRYGIERKQRSAADTDRLIGPLLGEGHSTAEIAKQVGVSDTAVRQSAKRLGLKLNDSYHAGEIITHNGYRMVQAPAGHPGTDSKGYIREHRLVMGQKLGRPLKKSEVVHHLNHDKLDNRPENLELMDLGSHTSLHHTGKVGRGPDVRPRKRK